MALQIFLGKDYRNGNEFHECTMHNKASGEEEVEEEV